MAAKAPCYISPAGIRSLLTKLITQGARSGGNPWKEGNNCGISGTETLHLHSVRNTFMCRYTPGFVSVLSEQSSTRAPPGTLWMAEPPAAVKFYQATAENTSQNPLKHLPKSPKTPPKEPKTPRSPRDRAPAHSRSHGTESCPCPALPLAHPRSPAQGIPGMCWEISALCFSAPPGPCGSTVGLAGIPG